MSINSFPYDEVKSTVVTFIKSTSFEIPKEFDDDYDLSYHLEFNTFNGVNLNIVANIMQHVYFPLIQYDSGNNAEKTTESESNVSIKYELNSNLTKFEQQLRQAVYQVNRGTQLKIPSVEISDVTKDAQNDKIVALIEASMEEWTSAISTAVEIETSKEKEKLKTPLGEIEFWRRRCTDLSPLYEQLNSSVIRNILAVVIKADSPQLSNFHFHFDDFTKMYNEAQENVKFLVTLERHFKQLQSESYRIVSENMPSMVNGLRMIWVISRHYNTDERMGSLLEMISETLIQRIKNEVK
jgi:dynein heavy chain